MDTEGLNRCLEKCDICLDGLYVQGTYSPLLFEISC